MYGIFIPLAPIYTSDFDLFAIDVCSGMEAREVAGFPFLARGKIPASFMLKWFPDWRLGSAFTRLSYIQGAEEDEPMFASERSLRGLSKPII